MTLSIYVIAALATVVGMMALSYVLGERHASRRGTEVYESGVPATGPAHVRLVVPYYLVAVLFVIFDVEVAFLFAWAIALHEAGWPGYLGAAVFVAVLGVALVYEVRMGVLKTARPSGRTRSRPGNAAAPRATAVLRVPAEPEKAEEEVVAAKRQPAGESSGRGER